MKHSDSSIRVAVTVAALINLNFVESNMRPVEPEVVEFKEAA
jgi:hypothetical protein